MRWIDILFLLFIIAFLYWVTKKGKKRSKFVEEADFTDRRPINVNTSSYFTIPLAKEDKNPFYMVVDTETVDLMPRSQMLFVSEDSSVEWSMPLPPPIVRLSWTLLNKKGEFISEETHTLRQNIEISLSAQSIHKITNQEMLECGEEPQKVYHTFCSVLMKSNILVAHNLSFHFRAIQEDMKRQSMQFPIWSDENCFCTMQKGQEYWGKKGSIDPPFQKLEDLYGSLYWGRTDLVMTFDEKSQRDRLLVIACLRYLMKELN